MKLTAADLLKEERTEKVGGLYPELEAESRSLEQESLRSKRVHLPRTAQMSISQKLEEDDGRSIEDYKKDKEKEEEGQFSEEEVGIMANKYPYAGVYKDVKVHRKAGTNWFTVWNGEKAVAVVPIPKELKAKKITPDVYATHILRMIASKGLVNTVKHLAGKIAQSADPGVVGAGDRDFIPMSDPSYDQSILPRSDSDMSMDRIPGPGGTTLSEPSDAQQKHPTRGIGDNVLEYRDTDTLVEMSSPTPLNVTQMQDSDMREKRLPKSVDDNVLFGGANDMRSANRNPWIRQAQDDDEKDDDKKDENGNGEDKEAKTSQMDDEKDDDKKNEKDNEKEAVSPPGGKHLVEEMKKHPEITNPHALAWWMKSEDQGPWKHGQGRTDWSPPGDDRDPGFYIDQPPGDNRRPGPDMDLPMIPSPPSPPHPEPPIPIKASRQYLIKRKHGQVYQHVQDRAISQGVPMEQAIVDYSSDQGVSADQVVMDIAREQGVPVEQIMPSLPSSQKPQASRNPWLHQAQDDKEKEDEDEKESKRRRPIPLPFPDPIGPTIIGAEDEEMKEKREDEEKDASLIIKSSDFEGVISDLEARLSKKYESKFDTFKKAYTERFVRAVMLAADRQRLNQEQCALKIAMGDALSEPHRIAGVSMEGLGEDHIYQIVEAAFETGNTPFVQSMVRQALKFVDMPQEAFLAIETDTKRLRPIRANDDKKEKDEYEDGNGEEKEAGLFDPIQPKGPGQPGAPETWSVPGRKQFQKIEGQEDRDEDGYDRDEDEKDKESRMYSRLARRAANGNMFLAPAPEVGSGGHSARHPNLRQALRGTPLEEKYPKLLNHR